LIQYCGTMGRRKWSHRGRTLEEKRTEVWKEEASTHPDKIIPSGGGERGDKGEKKMARRYKRKTPPSDGKGSRGCKEGNGDGHH